VLLAAACAAALAATAAAQGIEESPDLFPAGPHRDAVFYFCTACHSSRLVRNQAMGRDRWSDTLDWMTERHGMPALEGEERERFLDYLTGAFGPEAGAARRSPFLTQPARKNPFLD
jgi:hypothetical protein